MTDNTSPALDLLDVQGIASYLNISPRTARRIVSERRVPVTNIGALVRVRRADLDAYLAAHTTPAAPGSEQRPMPVDTIGDRDRTAARGVRRPR